MAVTMQSETIRSKFPHINQGITWLNHAATSPFSQAVHDAIASYSTNRMHGEIDTWQQDYRIRESIRRHLSSLCAIPNVDDIALIQNTSEGLNIVAQGLTWKSGDRILLNSVEFPSNVYPFLNLQRQGVVIDFIEADNGCITIEQIEAALHPRTRMVAISAVQFLSGWKADLKSIGDLCRQRDIDFVVDGIQAVGASAVDVQDYHISALSAGGQKWQMGPQGTGFLYLDPQFAEKLNPAYLGWLNVKTPWDFFNYDQQPAKGARRFEIGTTCSVGQYGYEAALSLLTSIGIKNIESHLSTLTDHIHRLANEAGYPIYGSDRKEHRAGIVVIDIAKQTNADEIAKQLNERYKVVLSARGGRLRIAPHIHNTLTDIVLCMDAIRELLSGNTA
jgi:selenocysteine lyase/cysteine desulfurase